MITFSQQQGHLLINEYILKRLEIQKEIQHYKGVIQDLNLMLSDLMVEYNHLDVKTINKALKELQHEAKQKKQKKICKKCHVVLNDDNWYPSLQKRNVKLCKKCNYKKVQECA